LGTISLGGKMSVTEYIEHYKLTVIPGFRGWMVSCLVVHYNGKKFDMPTLNKEFIKAGMSPVEYEEVVGEGHNVKEAVHDCLRKVGVIKDNESTD
jgi:hypothetical protein